jgi:hypothetical protein
MILIRIIGMDPDSDTVRQAAESYGLNSDAIIHVGKYIGYRDAPNPTTDAVRAARDKIVSDIEADYPVTVETVSAAEQDRIIAARNYFPDAESGPTFAWPSWYEPADPDFDPEVNL